MLDGLKKEGYISHGLDPDQPASRSGHAADRITELFTDPRMIGDAEQYSVAAALMARQLGFPARVVFGFAPQGSASTARRDRRRRLGLDRGRHRRSTAGSRSIRTRRCARSRPSSPQDPTKIARPQSVVPPPADKVDPKQSQTTPDTTQSEPDALDPALVVLLQVLQDRRRRSCSSC